MTTASATAARDSDTARRIRELGPWFQNLRIDGIETAPDHFLGDYPSFKWDRFRHVLPEDLQGASVLDIGCNAGFYSLEMARRGAGRVLGIDTDPRYLAQARFAADRSGAGIEFRQMDVYDVGRLGERFDLVIFMGVLYHLRHPLLALDLLYEHAVGGEMLFQSMQKGSEAVPEVPHDHAFADETPFAQEGYPSLLFIEERYAADPTNWFAPNRAAMEAMLRSAGFEIAAHPEREVYLCTRGTRGEGVAPPPRVMSRA